ncbi:hypothetical protein J2T07_003251 [Luteibacter jiangsuensis]|uniref:Deaminase of polymorphic toxin system n=1 Tax=Luteibacter jiangsuensis TaxID=637577 RepID=A0ABT9T193_9GAMM|nr:hypothetical protein [Luteibacter jiangsuensis]MDQ0011045.1 hypothetical protein [Luteibacter jiangsuensis]
MNMTVRRWIMTVLATVFIAALAAGHPSWARDSFQDGVTLLSVDQDDDHMMRTWIGVAMSHYANAMAGWLVDASRNHGGYVSVQALSRFQQQLRRATFAHFEYRYVVEGVPFTRTYLAASGRGFMTYIDPREPGLVAPSEPDSEYFKQDDVVTFAMAAATTEGSEVLPQPVRPNMPNRGNDAEIKVLQAIIRDIREGIVAPAGHLLGFVSKQPCESCDPALRQFAVETGSEVHVNYVFGANQDGLRTPAWAALREAREAIVDDLVTMFSAPAASTSPDQEDPLDDDSSSGSVCRRP